MSDINKPLRLTRQIEMFKLMDANIQKLESGYFEYLNGYNDERIATHFGVHQASVARLRKQLFGGLQRGGAAAIARTTRAYASQHTARVDSIEDRLTALEAQFNAAFGLRAA